MPAYKHIPVGTRFARWLTIGEPFHKGSGRKIYHVKCRCDCGTERDVDCTNLRQAQTKSCGCYDLELKTPHGKTNTPIWTSWQHMMTRCANPNNEGFADYGGRGIKVCERWSDFRNFMADMGERPPGTSLDRIDVNGHYEPGNCRWATRYQQSANVRRTTYVEWRGEKRLLIELAREFGIPYSTIRKRYLKLKWPIEKCLIPSIDGRRVT